MLDDGEFGEDFGVIHLHHAFIDFTPSSCHAGDVVKHRGMFPKRPLFHIVDEADGAEVQVFVAFTGYGCGFCDVCWIWRTGEGTFDRGLGCGGDGGTVLGAAKDVGDEGVVIETPDAVGACGLEGVGFYEAADEEEVGLDDV